MSLKGGAETRHLSGEATEHSEEFNLTDRRIPLNELIAIIRPDAVQYNQTCEA